jgi:hypothetical protein
MTETPVQRGVLNRPAARFVAIGLFLMGFFTLLWASWSLYGLPLVLGVVVVVIFGAFAVVFVVNGLQLIRSASRLPEPAGEESRRRGHALQLGFGITFASEGVVIAVVCALLAINGASHISHRRSRWSSACISFHLASCSAAPSITTSPPGWSFGPLSVSG